MPIKDQIKVEKQVKSELELYQSEQTKLEQLQNELQADPKFAQFIEAQQSFRKLESEVWGKVEQVMKDNNIVSIKTDLVTLTIANRTSYDVDLDLLPNKFIKKVPDTTKIATAAKLNGEPPKGCSPKVTSYLVKRFK
jgi:hypothetical protein